MRTTATAPWVGWRRQDREWVPASAGSTFGEARDRLFAIPGVEPTDPGLMVLRGGTHPLSRVEPAVRPKPAPRRNTGEIVVALLSRLACPTTAPELCRILGDAHSVAVINSALARLEKRCLIRRAGVRSERGRLLVLWEANT